MNHAWSSNPSRDAAVRVAEDGRDRPLPTLGECIDGMIPKSVPASSAVDHENKGVGMAESGLRTERVTLEVTYDNRISNNPHAWNWSGYADAYRVGGLLSGESVRVVEEEERQAPPTTKTATTENDYVPPAPVSRPAETRQTKAERIGGGWWFPKYDKPSAPPPPPPAPPRVHRGSGVFDANGDEVPWEGVVAALTEERDAAIRERDTLRASAITQSLTADRFASAVQEADTLRARVAELESRNVTHGEGSCAAQAASGGGVIRDMTDSLRSNTADADEKHAALATLVEAVCPGWALTQAASGGGEGEPVVDDSPFVWAVIQKGRDHSWCFAFRRHKDQAQEEFPPSEFVHVPLYRQPPQPRGWLTEEERDLIAGITDDDEYTEEGQNIAKALLARSSPPEVVLPEMVIAYDDMDALKEALAAAGVAVKEAGRD